MNSPMPHVFKVCIFRKKIRIRYLYFSGVCGRWVKHQRVFTAPMHESVFSSNALGPGFRCIFVFSLIVFSALFFFPHVVLKCLTTGGKILDSVDSWFIRGDDCSVYISSALPVCSPKTSSALCDF